MPLRAVGNRLFRRRQVWLPTPLGLLVLLGVGTAALSGLALAANRLLALNEPVRGPGGRGAAVLVVEGWLPGEGLDQAIEAFGRGHYARVVTTGGPILDAWNDSGWQTYAERAADYLRRHGLTSVPVTAVPAPESAQDRTFLSAVMLRQWAQREGVKLDAIDLYSGGVHARRSRLLFEMALGPEVEVGVLSAKPSGHDPERWWTSSVGAKSVVMETVGVVWTRCCFWPPAPGSHEERWGPR